MNAIVRLCGLTLLILAVAAAAQAQPGPCTLSGTLKQKNGTAVNGAQLTCTQGTCTGTRTTQAPNGSFTCPTCEEGTVTVSGTHNNKTYSQNCTCAGLTSECAIEVPNCTVGSASESSGHAALVAIGFALIRHRRRREPLDGRG